MFKKILIANRGEIACRVIRTARAMGIKTVAVYSEPDADALHVREADEAVLIGPASSSQSYLAIDKIVEAARQTGADAVHPGYGFLSENTKFAEALDQAGIAFIGPPASAIAAMGDKIESKKLAEKAGVNSVPGHLAPIADADEARRIARTIGYPVMLKASAGGGGKGMRIARSDEEVEDGFRGATNEARTAFGDDRVFVEKYIEQPRHIEIQVLADAHGNTIFLGERECSIQRRHQKVIEEAPSPFLDSRTRSAMGAQAVALAKAVGYRSAGTVEFIVDAERNFYFLEMNTRLQVEHPVTEIVTGLDLVELMIRIAAGEKLPIKQKDVTLQGWAIEARVYAEDPARGFLPSIGRLVKYREPPTGGAIRVDSGVYEGAEIGMNYDPLVAKLIASGRDRHEAIANLREALDGFVIEGIGHNIPFLAALAGHPRFAAGELTTNFIAEEFPDGFASVDPDEAQARLLVSVGAVIHHQLSLREKRISGQLRVPQVRGGAEWVVLLGADGEYRVTVVETADGFAVIDRKASHEVASDWRPGESLFRGRIDARPITVQIVRSGVGYRLVHGGVSILLKILSPRAAELHRLMPVKQAPDMSRFLLSPMPGLLISLAVAEGDLVKAGQELAVVEAMKMENILRAASDGRVHKVLAESGASLVVDQPILEFAQ
ncbi:MAG: acetyl/propionyl/methylcrotonyl-CoA carboxylase subunit alpha [Rhodospirillaceae bacterium]|nr:acetyl/propionyl/methylcrotonyl-CoA carboxylase subunit alpha [Rhodospirillaceae bacterium]